MDYINLVKLCNTINNGTKNQYMEFYSKLNSIRNSARIQEILPPKIDLAIQLLKEMWRWLVRSHYLSYLFARLRNDEDIIEDSTVVIKWKKIWVGSSCKCISIYDKLMYSKKEKSNKIVQKRKLVFCVCVFFIFIPYE